MEHITQMVTDREIEEAIEKEFDCKVIYAYDMDEVESAPEVFLMYYGKIEPSTNRGYYREYIILEHVTRNPDEDTRFKVIESLPSKLELVEVTTKYYLEDDYRNVVQTDRFEFHRKVRMEC